MTSSSHGKSRTSGVRHQGRCGKSQPSGRFQQLNGYVIPGVLLAVATLFLYWPVRSHDFINYDDQQYVTENTHVQAGVTWTGFLWAFQTGHSANWHPLTWLSHMLDCQIFGLNPTGHHLVNLGLHIANTLLLFLLLARVTSRIWPGAFVAALFALHPLHVESVAWIAERKDLLSTFLALLALLAYARYAQVLPAQNGSVQYAIFDNRQGRSSMLYPRMFYSLALVLFALSLMSKPMFVTLPCLLLLLDFWPLQRVPSVGHRAQSTHSLASAIQYPASGSHRPKNSWFRLLLEKLPFFLLSAISSLITILVQRSAMQYYERLPFLTRAANASVSVIRYVFKTAFPKNLSILYPHPGGWPLWSSVTALLLISVISAGTFVLIRKHAYVATGWFWFLGMLVPVLGLVQVGVQAMADRYTYFPLIGIFVAVVWATADWAAASAWRRRIASAAAFCVLMACALATRYQLQFWRDTETVFTHAISVTSSNWVAHENLALLYLTRYENSQRAALPAVSPQSSLTDTAKSYDHLQTAVQHAEAALQANPFFPDIHVTLAKSLTQQGNPEQALPHLLFVTSVRPNDPDAHENLAEIFSARGQPEEAVRQFKLALEARPAWPAVANNLAWLLATHSKAGIRNGKEAVRLAESACSATARTNFSHLQTLAAAYAEAGDFMKAIITAEQAKNLAEAAGNPELIRKAESRLQLYQSARPLRDP